MSLKITRIDLDGFRGYSRLVIDDVSNLVIIIGPNAVGKTNVIEGIQLLTSASSFRSPSWSETISWGCEYGRVTITMKDGKRELEHRMTVTGNDRVYEVNGKKKGPASVRGALPCVLFIPDDIQLIKASSGKRRDAIDSLAVQLSKNYASLKSDYQKSLRQRNLLLKEGVSDGFLFESWNESLAVHGSRLCLSRWRLFDRLFSHMKKIYEQVVPHEHIDAVYIPSWQRIDEQRRQLIDISEYEGKRDSSEVTLEDIEQSMLDAFKVVQHAEAQRGVSLIGPHKDEIAFFINGKNARLFASQGQQRTIVLVMKLAAVELVNEILGTEPVLLLDDVMSELDEKHRDALMSFIEKNAQTFITTTNLEYFSEDLLSRARIVQVPIEGTRYEY